MCLCNKILKVESGPNRISADGRVWAVRGKWLTGDSKQVLVIDAISSRRAALGTGKCSLLDLVTRGRRGGHHTSWLLGVGQKRQGITKKEGENRRKIFFQNRCVLDLQCFFYMIVFYVFARMKVALPLTFELMYSQLI